MSRSSDRHVWPEMGDSINRSLDRDQDRPEPVPEEPVHQDNHRIDELADALREFTNTYGYPADYIVEVIDSVVIVTPDICRGISGMAEMIRDWLSFNGLSGEVEVIDQNRIVIHPHIEEVTS